MKKTDIRVVRESIAKIVSLLTKQAIKVTQRGTKAYVQYHSKTGAVQLVNIPYLPDDASESFVSAVQGFLDHEVAHVLFTDQRVVMQAAKMGARTKNLHNAFEDVYIERRMSEAFPGAVSNLDATRRFHAERIALPKIKEALASGNIEMAKGYASILQIRAWGGQRIAADTLRDNPGIAALCKDMAERLGPELIARIGKIKSSADALDIARKARERLEPPPKPPEAAPPEGAKKPEGVPSASPEVGDEPVEPDEPGEDSPGEDEGTTRTEADDSGKEREDGPSKTDAETDEAGEDGGDSGEEADGERDDEEGHTPDAESSEPESASGTEDGDGEADDDGDSDDSDDTEDDADGEDLGDTADGRSDTGGGESAEADAGEDGEMGEGGEGEVDADAEESTDEGSTASSKAKPEGTDDAEEESEATSEEPPADLAAAFDEERDFDEEVSRALTDKAVEEIHSSSYRIFSTDWDVVEPAPMAHHEASVTAMIEQTRPMISAIQKSLERAMASRARKTWNPGQRRGRISAGSLYRTATGDDRVFRQRFETRARTTVASLVVDCSGSMSGSRIRTAGKAAYALSATLERLKIKHEVIGFTTRDSRAMVTAMRSEGIGVKYARDQALYMPVFKGFSDRLDTDACSRMAHLTEGPSWLKENVDGECVRIAAHRLTQQRAERHVMIVLSDGSPCCPGDRYAQTRHLKASVQELNQAPTLEVVGIGIEHRGVSEFYDKHVFLDELDQLPTTVVAQLAKILLAE